MQWRRRATSVRRAVRCGGQWGGGAGGAPLTLAAHCAVVEALHGLFVAAAEMGPQRLIRIACDGGATGRGEGRETAARAEAGGWVRAGLLGVDNATSQELAQELFEWSGESAKASREL